MEFDILREMIDVIRAEQQRRASLLTDKDTNFAYDQWIFKDEPFVNELCLKLLVTLSHQVERELVRLAALADDEGSKINGQQYQEKIEQLRKGKSWDFKEIENYEGITNNIPIEIFARNEIPEILCDECGKFPAVEICPECQCDGSGWLCGSCANNHKCDQEMFLPVVNSPRAGVCGYSG